ncbi:hypothetical protein BDV38DRAFT_265876 [Aspergillus pseudotamarii]|uniref:Uncharacterized protein n=1 Tax=Aspergillus pseudotamarii TaxID=132259 RepID=A0A5N6S8C1_ASPPS|nr:uncharacterized protein BDV38DRAFT_265876 [Aspergillus pseudotamarii]KAE8130918.1 hypothetical protein BDV38DRAFT_265876 [Aspergillus pseudotamarii]
MKLFAIIFPLVLGLTSALPESGFQKASLIQREEAGAASEFCDQYCSDCSVRNPRCVICVSYSSGLGILNSSSLRY